MLPCECGCECGCECACACGCGCVDVDVGVDVDVDADADVWMLMCCLYFQKQQQPYMVNRHNAQNPSSPIVIDKACAGQWVKNSARAPRIRGMCMPPPVHAHAPSCAGRGYVVFVIRPGACVTAGAGQAARC